MGNLRYWTFQIDLKCQTFQIDLKSGILNVFLDALASLETTQVGESVSK